MCFIRWKDVSGFVLSSLGYCKLIAKCSLRKSCLPPSAIHYTNGVCCPLSSNITENSAHDFKLWWCNILYHTFIYQIFHLLSRGEPWLGRVYPLRQKHWIQCHIESRSNAGLSTVWPPAWLIRYSSFVSLLFVQFYEVHFSCFYSFTYWFVYYYMNLLLISYNYI